MKNRLGEDVDRGLLLQSSEDQRIWTDELGDLANLSSQKLGFINAGRGTCPEVIPLHDF